MKNIHRNSQAFTVIELLVATTAFAFIVLFVSIGLIKINNTYYKGVTQSNTENVARAIVDNISQDIQFDSGTPAYPGVYPNSNTPQYAICTGGARYSVQLGHELKEGSNDHVLMRDTPTTCSPGTPIPNLQNTANPPPLPSGATELLSPNMRLAALTVSQPNPNNSRLYKIYIRLIAGDDDLLCSQNNVPGSCNSSTAMTNDGSDTNFVGTDVTCKPTAGSQFCAVAEFTANVEKRI